MNEQLIDLLRKDFASMGPNFFVGTHRDAMMGIGYLHGMMDVVGFLTSIGGSLEVAPLVVPYLNFPENAHPVFSKWRSAMSQPTIEERKEALKNVR